MENKTQVRNLAHGNTANPLNDLVPGRSMAPPAFALKASKDSFIRHKIGRNGINDPADLHKLGQHLVNAGIPASIVQQLGQPDKLGAFIEKYQAEVLGWRNTDGCIDPGGKTLEAMLNLRGKDVVLGWFTAPETTQEVMQPSKGPKATKKENNREKLIEGENWIIPPLMSSDDYVTQAPKEEAQGAKTLTEKQLLSHGLADYAPGNDRDIRKPKNWPRHSRWNNKKRGHWKDYKGAIKATHWIACHNACIYMANAAGVTGVSQDSGYNQKMKASDVKGATAASLIDPQLKAGKVVVVRVDGHHSILVIGKGRDAKGNFYAFFDPGRTGEKGHDLKKNRLYITEKSISNGKYSSITGVRDSAKK